MVPESFIKKIILGKSANNVAVLKTIWNDDSVILQIIEFIDIEYCIPDEYCGQLHIASLKNTSEKLGKPFELFFDEIKQALTQDSAVDGDFVFELNSEKKFKCLKRSSVKLLYAEVELESKFGLSGHLLIDALAENCKLKSIHESKCLELEKLDKAYGEMKEINDAYVAKQQTMESKYLTKFFQLLNEKKVKIRQLEADLSRLKENSDESHFSLDTPENNNNMDIDMDTSILPKRKDIIAMNGINPSQPKPSTSAVTQNTSVYDQDTQEMFDNI